MVKLFSKIACNGVLHYICTKFQITLRLTNFGHLVDMSCVHRTRASRVTASSLPERLWQAVRGAWQTKDNTELLVAPVFPVGVWPGAAQSRREITKRLSPNQHHRDRF